MEVQFKEAFVEKFKKLMGNELEEFLKYTSLPLRESIFLNSLKTNVRKLKKRLEKKGWKLEQIPFCENGFWVSNYEGKLGNTIEHFLGYYYVQEASSMLPPVVLEPNENDIVLDMCASPGSKTTQIANIMNNKGIIVANDVRMDRIKILRTNLQRRGVLNAIVTLNNGISFKKFPQKYDKILLDAPCSGEGAIRKDWGILKMWNQKGCISLSRTQKKLIESAFLSLRNGGIMVYSTCTLSPEENEEVVNFLLEKYEDAELLEIKIPKFKVRRGITKWEGKEYSKELKKCIRVYPQDNDTEGFFVAKVRKK